MILIRISRSNSLGVGRRIRLRLRLRPRVGRRFRCQRQLTVMRRPSRPCRPVAIRASRLRRVMRPALRVAVAFRPGLRFGKGRLQRRPVALRRRTVGRLLIVGNFDFHSRLQ